MQIALLLGDGRGYGRGSAVARSGGRILAQQPKGWWFESWGGSSVVVLSSASSAYTLMECLTLIALVEQVGALHGCLYQQCMKVCVNG